MLKQATASYPTAAGLSRQATITSARVDPEAPPAIFPPASPHRASTLCPKAPVAELVDALDSKSSSARSAGSIPARGTIRLHQSFGEQEPRIADVPAENI